MIRTKDPSVIKFDEEASQEVVSKRRTADRYCKQNFQSYRYRKIIIWDL